MPHSILRKGSAPADAAHPSHISVSPTQPVGHHDTHDYTSTPQHHLPPPPFPFQSSDNEHTPLIPRRASGSRFALGSASPPAEPTTLVLYNPTPSSDADAAAEAGDGVWTTEPGSMLDPSQRRRRVMCTAAIGLLVVAALAVVLVLGGREIGNGNGPGDGSWPGGPP